MALKKHKRLRSYITDHASGKAVRKMIAWSQNRCCKCQRFLRKHQQKYCDDCAKKVISKYKREWIYNDRHFHK